MTLLFELQITMFRIQRLLIFKTAASIHFNRSSITTNSAAIYIKKNNLSRFLTQYKRESWFQEEAHRIAIIALIVTLIVININYDWFKESSLWKKGMFCVLRIRSTEKNPSEKKPLLNFYSWLYLWRISILVWR